MLAYSAHYNAFDNDTHGRWHWQGHIHHVQRQIFAFIWGFIGFCEGYHGVLYLLLGLRFSWLGIRTFVQLCGLFFFDPFSCFRYIQPFTRHAHIHGQFTEPHTYTTLRRNYTFQQIHRILSLTDLYSPEGISCIGSKANAFAERLVS